MNRTKKGIALITGPTSGIGKAFAFCLAEQGYDLVLVSRRKNQLKQLANSLLAKYHTHSECVVADLSLENDIARIENYIKSLNQLSLLINNAGFGVGGYFLQVPLAEQMQMVNVHLSSTIRFCRAAIPILAKEKNGSIINVASFSAFMQLPGSVMYTTTKAAVVSFSQTLQLELKPSGIKVQALCPAFTPTSFHASINREVKFVEQIPDYLWIPAEKVVNYSLKSLKRKRVVCVPGFLYQTIYTLNKHPLISALIHRIARPKQQNLKTLTPLAKNKEAKQSEKYKIAHELELSSF
ncbi:SDR family NAD(P)-dependent oxidoreductase [Carboxylicivirga sp. N1Y90]|uniref:SDR family NAD(P)-dependent oxidoreductase n=1 Tax=Carboxylicivirga fragile TaxID=3417571 RepID=UPI003D325E82|nr:SDR family NAD(P)-dependent oxidoreductase [Marinilabiliaceae bacterium N1Y90]